MPFIHWEVEPKFVSRKPIDPNSENVFESVANNSLVGILQQLSSLVKHANCIFEDVATDLKNIHNRSKSLSTRIRNLAQNISNLDAKSVPVPLGDLTKFSVVKEHYESSQPQRTELFRSEDRPLCVRMLYKGAALSPVHIIREIDRFRQDGCRSSKYFICTPIFRDEKAVRVDLEIETRRPASFCEARDWQSDDELGFPDIYLSKEETTAKRCQQLKDLLRLPSPEERTHALSLKYPYSDVPIDVTGSSFRRMASFRRSLMQQVEFFTRKKKKKKSKSDRRNTISGGPEIEKALEEYDLKKDAASSVKSKKRFSIAIGGSINGMDHLYSSLHRPAENKSVQTMDDEPDKKVGLKSKFYAKSKKESEDDEKRSKSSKKKSSIPISTYSQAMSLAVKLRDNAHRHKGKGEDSGQSSSGNWSASSSTRTSVESESLRPVNTPDLVRTNSQTSVSKDSALSEGTIQDDIRSIDTGYGASGKTSGKPKSSVTEHWLRGLSEEMPSEDTTDGTSTTGTLTPLLSKRDSSPYDIPMAFMDDEDSSVYSVDTDGYYTSMHTDSGLRSLSSSSKPVDGLDKDVGDDAENASTLSSVSTLDHTDSSGGEVPAKKVPPQPPRRNSSLSVKAPVPRPSPSPSPESDVEGRSKLQEKTIINASRIPSMCIVTPNPSDDEFTDSISVHSNGSSSGSVGFRSHTLPRSFKQTHGSNPRMQYNTNSWPRSPSAMGRGKENSSESINSASPRLPLKYVHHITITPGRRVSPLEPKQLLVAKNEVIYATNSLDRRKTAPIRGGHVTLNCEKEVDVHLLRQGSVNSNHQSAGSVSPTNVLERKTDCNPLTSGPPSYLATMRNRGLVDPRTPPQLKYTSNTLPRAKSVDRPIPAPVFPSNHRVSFHPSVHAAAATLPRNHGIPTMGLPKRHQSPPSPDEESSSPRSSTIDLPPPMTLISPTMAVGRWPGRDFTTHSRNQVSTRPSFLPVPAGSGIGSPAYRPPPSPQTANYSDVSPSHAPLYRLVPRTQGSPTIPQQPGRYSSPMASPQQPPLPPQRHYVLNVGGNASSPKPQDWPQSPITPQCGRNANQMRYLPSPPTIPVNGSRAMDLSPLKRSQTLPLKGTKRETNPKPMSNDDLFTAIHLSKKRLNLRTESERSSSPLSCRSDSPSMIGGRMKTPETGNFRSLMTPGDRKSWAGDSGNGSGDRKSWALDRFGPNKPTTMHDFKMLLLQAGRNSGIQTERQRMSATEMLKVSTGRQSPTPQSPVRNRIDGTNGEMASPPTTPQRASPRPVYHSPYNRGRFRFPLHPHTDILSSPIWEDNMEEMEGPEEFDAIKARPLAGMA